MIFDLDFDPITLLLKLYSILTYIFKVCLHNNIELYLFKTDRWADR